jgi:hypothetical protein
MALNAMDKAIPDLERAVKAISDESTQDSLYARYFLSMCYEHERDIDKAIAQWEMISGQKKNFRDVGEKLAQYQELRGNDNLKDYLTASQPEFMELCRSLADKVLDLHITDSKMSGDCCEIKAIENESAKWRNTRKMPRLMRFFRGTDPLDEEKVRSILEDAKADNMPKAALFSNAGFSKSAIEYASSRSVELCGKEKLEELLRKISHAKPARRPSKTASA